MTREKAAVVEFLAGYSVADHLGDVSNGIEPLAKAFGIDLGDWEEQQGVLDALICQGLFNERKWEANWLAPATAREVKDEKDE